MKLLTENLSICLANNELIDVILQLNKDFQLSNVDLNINIKAQPIEIVDLLNQTILLLLVDSNYDIRNLLYIIDVSEKKIASLDSIDSDVIAQIIVERIIEKIKLRKMFS